MLTVYDIVETFKAMFILCLYFWLMYKTVDYAKRGDSWITLLYALLLYLIGAIILFK